MSLCKDLLCKDQNGIMLWILEIPGSSEELPTLCTGKLFYTSEKHPWGTGGSREQKPSLVAVTAHSPQLVSKKKRQFEVLGRESRCLCPHENFNEMLKGSLMVVGWGGLITAAKQHSGWRNLATKIDL